MPNIKYNFEDFGKIDIIKFEDFGKIIQKKFEKRINLVFLRQNLRNHANGKNIQT